MKKKPSASQVAPKKVARKKRIAPRESRRALPTGATAGTDPKRVRAILAKLDEAYPEATCALRHRNAFQLLIATILSAQCTDVRVNQVTQTLFQKYATPEAFAHANPRELEMEIRPTGFFRNKTKSIQGASKKILEEFKGAVPRTMDELLTLPGVARKTANVVMGTAFGIASGIVVDTHVQRLSGRLGLTRNTDPKKKSNRTCCTSSRRRNGFSSRTNSSGTGGAFARRAIRDVRNATSSASAPPRTRPSRPAAAHAAQRVNEKCQPPLR